MAWRAFAARLGTDALQRAVERDIEAEIESHLAEAAAALEAEGLAPDEARAKARERFGNLDQIRAECLRIRMGGLHAMNKLLVGALIAVTLALLTTLAAGYVLYTRARMAQEMAMAARMEALEAEQRAHEVSATAPKEIVVAIGDELELVDHSDRLVLGERAVVQPDGKVLLPWIGWLDVAGLTREQVELRLLEAYASQFEPPVTLYVIVHKPKATSFCIRPPVTTFASALSGRRPPVTTFTSVLFGAF
jgi:hypothetical protein